MRLEKPPEKRNYKERRQVAVSSGKTGRPMWKVGW